MKDIEDPDDQVHAILFEAIGQTFAVLGMAIAKWSLGLFLLRLVKQRWHKISIWVAMGCLMSASISTCFVFWLQCTPPQYLWDRRIPDGFCHIDSTPVSMLLCSKAACADQLIQGRSANRCSSLCYCRFLLCHVPMVFHLGPADEHAREDCHPCQPEPGCHVSQISIPKYFQMTYTSSAGACGIKRTVEVPALSSPNYLSKSPSVSD